MLRALCLGWGTQSFALAAMSALGVLDKLDVAVYSETEHEKKETYQFIEKWLPWLEDHGIWVAVLHNDAHADNYIGRQGNPVIPIFSSTQDRHGQFRRQCTYEWKIAPIRRFLQDERVSDPVELWFGITIDEFYRVRASDVSYISNRYPFMEMDWSREDCVEWLQNNNFPVPPRSACVFCPYTHIEDWREMKKNRPEDWAEAVRVDNAIRHVLPDSPSYLNRFYVPISELDDPQYTPKYALDEECDSGHCFV